MSVNAFRDAVDMTREQGDSSCVGLKVTMETFLNSFDFPIPQKFTIETNSSHMYTFIRLLYVASETEFHFQWTVP